MSSENIDLPAACPLCNSALAVREVECAGCGVVLRGRFGGRGGGGERYQNLSPEQAVFLETFLRCRGVIRDVEAALGISYPTVRGRLDALLQRLGLAEPRPAEPDDARPAETRGKRTQGARPEEILRLIDAGELDPAAAIEALKRSGAKPDGSQT